MQVWMVGDDDRSLSVWIERYLGVDVQAGMPAGPDEHVVIAAGCPVPDQALTLARVLILIEPDQAEEDCVVRERAAKAWPRLHIVAHVAARIRAERGWPMLLSLTTRIQQATDRLRNEPVSRSDLSNIDPPYVERGPDVRPLDMFGRTIGFVGFGPMGWRMAELAAHMGMHPIYWPEPAARGARIDTEGGALVSGAVEARFDDLLATADVVVLDVSASDQNVRIIDAPELALMREDAVLLNIAHGRAIDEGALIVALRDGRLSGVGLDRFNYEPLPHDSPLRAFESVVLTPAITWPTQLEILERTAAEVAMVLGSPEGGALRRVRRVRRRRLEVT